VEEFMEAGEAKNVEFGVCVGVGVGVMVFV
jgi:hypothetical protein